MRGQKKRKKNSKLTVPKDKEIPADIGELIVGRTVRVSEPKRFFARKWKAMLPLVSDQVKETGNTFELQPKLFHSFMESLTLVLKLRNSLREQYADYRPSDLVADALCSAADDISDYPQGVHAWPLRMPFQDVIRFRDKGGEISVHIEPLYREGDSAPALIISVAGEPISALLNFNLMDDDSPKKQSAQIEARKIWDTIIKRLSVRIGVKRATRGKPGKDIGYYSAWAHDHAGWSWAKIARAECKQQHEHTADTCARNYRKLAEQFYLRQEKEYLEAGLGVTIPVEKRGSAPLK